MADKVEYTVQDSEGIQAAMGWVFDMLSRAIRGGPVVITLSRILRSLNQNSRMWPMLEDIRKHIPEWHGHKMTTDDYKDLLSALWKGQTLIPGVEGGFVVLGVRTSKLNKKEFSELIEVLYAFGSEHGVPWSDPSIETYETYREAANESGTV